MKKLSMAETANTDEPKRGHRKEREGRVISNKMAKTIVVEVERRFPHPRSGEALHATAQYWGTVAGVMEAEPFQLVREIQ